MRHFPLLSFLALAAFAAHPSLAASSPSVTLTETPAARLGTAPPGLGIQVGAKAPDATLRDVSGTMRRLSDLYAQGPVFILFYRGGWCPYCNLQLHDLAQAKPEFDKRGVSFVAISVDQPSQEAKTQAKHGIPFPMLSDPKLLAHKAFNVVHVPGDAEQHALTGYGVDLTVYSGETHKSFAVPSIFLVDRAGIVRFAHIDQDYRTRPSIQQMLTVADSTLGKTQ